MSIDIAIFGRLELKSEYPENSFSLSFMDEDGTQFTIYCFDAETWRKARAAFPKHSNFKLHRKNGVHLSGEEAETWATAFYQRETATDDAKRKIAVDEMKQAGEQADKAAQLEEMPF